MLRPRVKQDNQAQSVGASPRSNVPSWKATGQDGLTTDKYIDALNVRRIRCKRPNQVESQGMLTETLKALTKRVEILLVGKAPTSATFVQDVSSLL